MTDPRVLAFAAFMVSEWNGRKTGQTTGFKLNFDGRYGEQCMDLFNWVWTFLGIPSSAIHRTADAAGVWELAATEEIWKYFDGILPDQVFQPADVFVFNRNAFGSQGRGRGNGYGHIGMVIADNLNGTFDVLEANGLGDGYEDDYLNQYGSPARVHTWSKADLYGVLRPIPGMCPGLNDFGGIAAQGTITPTEEGFLMTLTDVEDRRVLELADMGLDTPGRKPGPRLLNTNDGSYIVALLEGISTQVGRTLNKDDGGYIVGLVSALKPGATDTDAIASALVAAVGKELAAEVVSAIGRKLGGG